MVQKSIDSRFFRIKMHTAFFRFIFVNTYRVFLQFCSRLTSSVLLSSGSTFLSATVSLIPAAMQIFSASRETEPRHLCTAPPAVLVENRENMQKKSALCSRLLTPSCLIAQAEKRERNLQRGYKTLIKPCRKHYNRMKRTEISSASEGGKHLLLMSRTLVLEVTHA